MGRHQWHAWSFFRTFSNCPSWKQTDCWLPTRCLYCLHFVNGDTLYPWVLYNILLWLPQIQFCNIRLTFCVLNLSCIMRIYLYSSVGQREPAIPCSMKGSGCGLGMTLKVVQYFQTPIIINVTPSIYYTLTLYIVSAGHVFFYQINNIGIRKAFQAHLLVN